MIFNTLREVKEGVHPKKYNRDTFVRTFNELLSTVGVLKEKKKHWLKYITIYQMRYLIGDPEREAEFLKALRKDLELVRF